MELNGEYLFDAPQDIVWEAVQDPDVLGSVMPGGEGVKEIGENKYETKLKIKVGPVQGKFKGTIELSNITPPNSYDIAVDGKGAPGFVKATGNLMLHDQGPQTQLVYSGKARVGGRIASVGQRLLDASAKAIVNQSLEALNEYLKVQVARRAAEQAAAAPVAAVAEAVSAEAETPAAAEAGAAAETMSAEERVEAATAPPAAAKMPPPKMPEYKPPSQTQLAASVAKDVVNDLIPQPMQTVIISVITTIITVLIMSWIGII